MYTSHKTLIALAVLRLSVGATFFSWLREKRSLGLFLASRSHKSAGQVGTRRCRTLESCIFKPLLARPNCFRHRPTKMTRVASPTHQQLYFFHKMSLVRSRLL